MFLHNRLIVVYHLSFLVLVLTYCLAWTIFILNILPKCFLCLLFAFCLVVSVHEIPCITYVVKV